ncbi:MAG TPA: hypothetical protein VK154_13495 [Chitinophagales bacterium]|nr:hypothetical protein [Chitinophagales bacterium]
MLNGLYQKYIVDPLTKTLRNELYHHQQKFLSEVDKLKLQNGKILCNQLLSNNSISNIQDAEFQVFSQWGDDGIIQYLINKVGVKNKTFIEFGVQDYSESNTRFLLMNNNWKGLIIDSDKQFMDSVKHDAMYWRHDLTAHCAFITVENVNSLFTDNGFKGNIGILSVDIDGNDYWVWENISSVDADIVIVEYNSLFGGKHAITVPYNPSFYRGNAHYSHLYWGTSVKALCHLAEKKGYIFVGCNSNGNNTYFVKKEKANGLKALTAEEGYVESRFRESRDKNGLLTFAGGAERVKLIEEMEVFDVEKNKTFKIKDLA